MLSALLLLALGLSGGLRAADRFASLEPLGLLIRECSLPGARRADDVVPRHANCIQVSRSRWLVVYSTHGFRGVDDERSIVWQLRRDAPDGPVLNEEFFARALSGWQPEGLPPAPPGTNYFKQHGHMVAFGVPKGGVLGGRPAPQANHFVAQWRVLGRPLELKRDYLPKSHPGTPLFDHTQGVEWVQFRLNDREDDLEILQPVRRLRQQGFEAGAKFCNQDGVAWMNQSFCPPVPTQADGAEWAMANHFDGGRVAAQRFRFNAATQRYEWFETGSLLAVPKRALSEASLARLPTGWLLASRAGGVAWTRAADPFARWKDTAFAAEPAVGAPLVAASGAMAWCASSLETGWPPRSVTTVTRFTAVMSNWGKR